MGNTDDITVLSLCTGYGGLEFGLHRALGRPLRVIAVEIEAFAAANLVAKAEEGKLAIEALYPDLKTFPAERFPGCFDFILAGYPCQPFSVAGKRKGEADERHLWPFIRDHIQQIRPVYCFFENVAGHLRLGFDRVHRDLDELGYTVEADLFTASEVGAPHKRERLFILAKSVSAGTGCLSGEIDGGSRQQVLRQGNGQACTSGIAAASELANASRLGRRGWDNGEPAGEGRALQTEGSGELADAESQRVQGHGAEGQQEPHAHAGQTLPVCGCDRGPARPGQEQYEWEEPRTVKSGMGRTVDGFRSRVDELRLLGNGVVPAQAELAFRTLRDKIQ